MNRRDLNKPLELILYYEYVNFDNIIVFRSRKELSENFDITFILNEDKVYKETLTGERAGFTMLEILAIADYFKNRAKERSESIEKEKI